MNMGTTNSGDSARAAMTVLVEETVEAKLKAREPFTALDISNELKARRFAVRHGEVAAVVRDIYASGAMRHYDYDRRLIDVVTDAGTKQAQAFLYLHDSVRERQYTARRQDALPPVPQDQARSLDDVVAAGNPISPLAALHRAAKTSQADNAPTRKRSSQRRDGALPIPRALVEQAGWQVGASLKLFVQAAAGMVLEPVGAQNDEAAVVRVWADLRVRVCKTKLQGTSLTAGSIRFHVEKGTLRAEPQ